MCSTDGRVQVAQWEWSSKRDGCDTIEQTRIIRRDETTGRVVHRQTSAAAAGALDLHVHFIFLPLTSRCVQVGNRSVPRDVAAGPLPKRSTKPCVSLSLWSYSYDTILCLFGVSDALGMCCLCHLPP